MMYLQWRIIFLPRGGGQRGRRVFWAVMLLGWPMFARPPMIPPYHISGHLLVDGTLARRTHSNLTPASLIL